MNDRRRIEAPLEIVRSKQADHRSVSVKLNLTGSLKAGKVSTVANIARPCVIVGMLMSWKNRNSGYHQQGADRQERYVLALYRHWRRSSRVLSV